MMKLEDGGIEALEDLEKEDFNRYDRYLIDGNLCVPLKKDRTIVKKNLNPGIFHVAVDFRQGLYFEKVKMTIDNIIDLPDPAMKTVLKTVNQFWSQDAGSKYQEYGITRKLGILLHGSPGTGKTILSARIAKEVINMGGIVLFNPQVKCYSKHLVLFAK